MIDYSAFEEKNVKKYNGKLPGLPRLSSPSTALIVVSILFVLIASPILIQSFPISIKIFVVILIIYAAYRLTWKGRASSVRTALFAKRNGFKYSWQGGKFKSLEGLGSVLGEPMMSNVITGQLKGQSFTLCGIYSEKLFKTVMRVSLSNKYPHIILDAKQNDKLVSSLHKIFPNNKEIELEGDFPQFFRVFTATTPVETLQILSPELMGRMIDYARKADVEILEDDLTLICNFKFMDKQTIKMLFESVVQIMKDIGVEANNSNVKFNSESRI